METNLLSSEVLNKLIKIQNHRQKAQDNLELKQNRVKWLEKLRIFSIEPIYTLEMYKDNDNEVIKSKPENYLIKNQHNTRTKIKSETCLEIDKLEQSKTIKLIEEVCQGLIRKKMHFCMFYAIGQRSPHIRIYDFNELEELTPFQRLKAQIRFWRGVVPFGSFQYVDTGIMDDDHYIQLEFAPHWKYGTPFNLLFEWLPHKPTPRNKYFVGGKEVSF